MSPKEAADQDEQMENNRSRKALLTSGFDEPQTSYGASSPVRDRGNEDASPLLRSGRASPPGKLQIPKMPSMAQVALSVMQYLPTPLLVLSSLKTIILANDAMGKLLGLDILAENTEKEEQGLHTTDRLLGQSLGQLGIDLLQDGRPVWVNWERFLDGLARQSSTRESESLEKPEDDSKEELRQRTHESMETLDNQQPSSLSAPSNRSESNGESRRQLNGKPFVQDTIVDVVLSSQFVGNGSAARDTKGLLPFHHVQARIIISIWNADGQQFFSLAFSASSPLAVASGRTQVRLASRTPNATSPASSSAGNAQNFPPSSQCLYCGAATESVNTPPTRTSPTGEPLTIAPYPLIYDVATPSVLQRTLKLKDAIINGMQDPKFAMWKDESVVVPNRAAEELMRRHTDSTSGERLDPLSRFTAYTEDFSRKLEPEENPIIALCRTQKGFRSWKVGYKDRQDKRTVYDISGECIYDESGEFIGGITVLKDVTEYADKIREQTDRNEQQFEVICDCIPQIVWTSNPVGGHDWFSKRWYEYTGLTEAQSLGEEWANTFHPDDIGETQKRWRHSLATGEEYVTEYRAKSRTGEWRWMLGRAIPLRDHRDGEILKWFGTCTDIHDLVEARSQQKRTHEQLLRVIEHAKVTVWSVDRDLNLTFLEGQLLWLEEGTEQETRDDLIGNSIQDAFSKHASNYDMQRHVEPLQKIIAGELGEHVSEHHIDGTGRWYRTRFVPIIGKNRQTGQKGDNYVEGVVGVSQDVSDLRRRELELHSTEKENLRLLSAETAAKEASRLKSQFLANMSHEIRTPIAGVIGMAELLADSDLEDDQRELAENIQRSANGLLTVINDILDLSKVESRRLDIEEVQFSISVVLRDIGKMMSFAAERKHLRFEEDININKTGDDLIVLGDPGRCRQILTNLLTNSIKFTTDGFVKMSAWIQDETAETVTVKFSVEDTGIGIEEEVRKKLFRPFSQADSSTARRFGGTGLGLTISKNLVELMKGSIQLDSRLGQGTRAFFTIPFSKPQFADEKEPLVDLGFMPDRFSNELTTSARGSSEHETPPSAPAHTLKVPALAQKAVSGKSSTSDLAIMLPPAQRKDIHVLVVEDNNINQQIAVRTIRKLGFSVSAVWNGKEALEYLLNTASATEDSKAPSQIISGESKPRRPDVILMDVQMPVLDGYRATHQIRHHDPYRSLPGMDNVPIVAMTASAIQGDKEKCERAGMDDYLAKPVKSTLLEKMLVKWAVRSKSSHGDQASTKSTLHRSISEHDSNCAESDAALNSLPPFYSPKHVQISGQYKEPTRSASPSFLDVISPSAESEGDRGLRRQAAEEKASTLRDDKLVDAATGHDNDAHQNQSNLRLHHTSSEQARSPSKYEALTEANLGTMNREREASSPLETANPHHLQNQPWPHNSSSRNEGLEAPNHQQPNMPITLGHEDSDDITDISAEVIGHEKTVIVSLGSVPPRSSVHSNSSSVRSMRMKVARNNSSTSEKTITPQDGHK